MIAMFSISSTTFPPPRAVATRRLNTARHVTLPYLFVLSLTTLFLGVIYAVCVGQNNHSRSEMLDPSQNKNASVVSLPQTNHYERSALGFVPYIYTKRNTTTNTTTPASNSTTAGQSEISLIFYSATLPLTTLVHASTEATLLKFRPDLLTHSQKSGIAIPYTLLAAQTLLTFGWIINTAFWTHCELAITHSSVCPAQVRDHLMYGILEVSIAKAAIGWALAAGYVVHVAFLVRWIRVVKRWEKISGLAGLLEREPEDKEEIDMGEYRSRIAEVEVRGEVKAATVVAAAQEARLQKERELKEQAERHGPPKEVPSFPPPPKRPTKKRAFRI